MLIALDVSWPIGNGIFVIALDVSWPNSYGILVIALDVSCQRSLSLSLVRPMPTTPSLLILGPTLNHLDHSFDFNTETIKEGDHR